MRFQTIGLLALFIIGIGAVGIYKSKDLISLSNSKEGEKKESLNEQETVLSFAVGHDSKIGSLISLDSLQLLPATFRPDDEELYITEDQVELLDSEVFILKREMEMGEFISFENIESLKNKNFTDIVLSVDRNSIEKFGAGFYNVYLHFNDSGRDKNSRKVKLFSKNVFIRPLDDSKKRILNDNENLSPVVFLVNEDIIGSYLQADQLGYFRIVHVTKNSINLENYSTLEVDSSQEMQANDISSSYKYDVNVIK